LSLEIRAATSGLDAQAVLILWGIGRTRHAATADTPEAVERLIATDPGSLLVALEGTELVGAVVAAFDGWRGNFYRLAVAPTRRRQGIGTRLVRAGEERLRARGATRVTALVAYEDEDARAFWTALGYPPDPAIGRHVRNL
jgi:ribosomal protein S18 acetylase RimI-like enzyme